MFTNNYINVQASGFFGNATTLTNVEGTKVDSLYEGNGGNCIGKYMRYGQCKEIVTAPLSPSQLTDFCGVFFGSGSTPAQKSDRKLENLITSGLSISSPSSVAQSNDGNGKYEFFAPFGITNTSASDINIYEIGLVMPVGQSTSQFYTFLMERTVLTAPITIAPGEGKLVTYKITFNQTLNAE